MTGSSHPILKNFVDPCTSLEEFGMFWKTILVTILVGQRLTLEPSLKNMGFPFHTSGTPNSRLPDSYSYW